MTSAYPLRPFLPADTRALQDLYAQSIEELTQEEYDEDQRLAWMAQAADAAAFAKHLAGMTTLVVQVDGVYLGFGSLKANKILEMLYVHPHHVGEGVATALCDALEQIAAARGAENISTEASETAVLFFEGRGYQPVKRNSIPLDGLWLTNTTMTKVLKSATGTTANRNPL